MAADDGFQSAEDALGDGGGADDDAANDAELLADAIAFDGEGGGDGEAGLGVGERVHGANCNAKELRTQNSEFRIQKQRAETAREMLSIFKFLNQCEAHLEFFKHRVTISALEVGKLICGFFINRFSTDKPGIN